jgi:flagellar basal-body rod modification protein FlgD
MGKDTFLKLLVAQLKYQDPEKPADATQFLSQTAQFTLVEKIDALSTLNQEVLDTSKAQAAMMLVGRTVSWVDVAGNGHTGVVTAASLGAQTPNLTVSGQTVSYDDITGTTG